MIPRELKLAYFALARVPMAINGARVRYLGQAADGPRHVHLGPGQERYLDGWINVDANIISAKPDVWADLRNPLPFAPDSVDAFYSHHVIEHLSDAFLPTHLADVHGCLRPGGVYRIGVPHGDVAIRKFTERDNQWFGDFPDNRTSIGGRFTNFLLCRGEHLTIMTESYLDELLRGVGFEQIEVRAAGIETGFPGVFGEPVMREERAVSADRESPHTLVIEAVKS